MKTDRIFVLLLVVMLPMSGCFDDAVGDAEGTDESEVNEELLNNSTNNENPLIYIWGQTLDAGCPNRTSCTFSWTISVMDIDGNVSSVGIDSDLDGVIDHEFISEDWTQHTQEFDGPVDWSSDNAVQKSPSHEWCYFAFNLIAIDDDGGKSIHPITKILGECD